MTGDFASPDSLAFGYRFLESGFSIRPICFLAVAPPEFYFSCRRVGCSIVG